MPIHIVWCNRHWRTHKYLATKSKSANTRLPQWQWSKDTSINSVPTFAQQKHVSLPTCQRTRNKHPKKSYFMTSCHQNNVTICRLPASNWTNLHRSHWTILISSTIHHEQPIYILVLHNHDSNFIYFELMCSRTQQAHFKPTTNQPLHSSNHKDSSHNWRSSIMKRPNSSNNSCKPSILTSTNLCHMDYIDAVRAICTTPSFRSTYGSASYYNKHSSH